MTGYLKQYLYDNIESVMKMVFEEEDEELDYTSHDDKKGRSTSYDIRIRYKVWASRRC